VQHVYTYRSAARNADWKVQRYDNSFNAIDLISPNAAKFHAWWALCHTGANPLEILEKVRALGGTSTGAVSNGSGHVDKVSCVDSNRF
jgi:hypothetical protein